MEKSVFSKIADELNDSSPVIGTCFGRPIRQDELLFDTEKKVYKISTEKGLIEIRPQDLLRSSNPSQDDFDKWYEAYASIKTDGISVAYNKQKGTMPWEDPLPKRAKDMVACADFDDIRYDSDGLGGPNVYYHDRYPSIPVRRIIDDAIELLIIKKRLRISPQYLRQEKDEWRLCIELTNANGSKRLLECVLGNKAFDRHTVYVDKYAKLKARLDTNTFLKLRIAYMLYQAQKLGDRDSMRVSLDVFRITRSITRR